MRSKYKVPKITAAKKTDQLADAQKGETIVTMKVKGYGEMQFKFFMKKAPLAVKNFVTLASNGYFDGQIFHRVINDFMIQSGDPTGTGTGGESIWGEDFDNEVCEELLPLRGSLYFDCTFIFVSVVAFVVSLLPSFADEHPTQSVMAAIRHAAAMIFLMFDFLSILRDCSLAITVLGSYPPEIRFLSVFALHP